MSVYFDGLDQDSLGEANGCTAISFASAMMMFRCQHRHELELMEWATVVRYGGNLRKMIEGRNAQWDMCHVGELLAIPSIKEGNGKVFHTKEFVGSNSQFFCTAMEQLLLDDEEKEMFMGPQDIANFLKKRQEPCTGMINVHSNGFCYSFWYSGSSGEFAIFDSHRNYNCLTGRVGSMLQWTSDSIADLLAVFICPSHDDEEFASAMATLVKEDWEEMLPAEQEHVDSAESEDVRKQRIRNIRLESRDKRVLEYQKYFGLDEVRFTLFSASSFGS